MIAQLLSLDEALFRRIGSYRPLLLVRAMRAVLSAAGVRAHKRYTLEVVE